MKVTKKILKRLIKEAVIKYETPDGAVMAQNATGIFSSESLEKQFQYYYDESIEYQKSIITNPDGDFDKLIDELGQANAAAKLYRYIESLLTAKYGTGSAIIFNLSDFSKRSEKEILDFPSIEKAVKRAIGYDIESVLYSGNTRDFPDTEGLPSEMSRQVSGKPRDLQISDMGDEDRPGFGFSSLSFYDDNDVTIPRHDYEPTRPRISRYEPTAVVDRK